MLKKIGRHMKNKMAQIISIIRRSNNYFVGHKQKGYKEDFYGSLILHVEGRLYQCYLLMQPFKS